MNAWTRILADDPLEAMQEQSIPSSVGKYNGQGQPPSDTLVDAGNHVSENGSVGPMLVLMDVFAWSNLIKELGWLAVFREKGEYRGVYINAYPYFRQEMIVCGDKRVERGKALMVMDDGSLTPLLEIHF